MNTVTPVLASPYFRGFDGIEKYICVIYITNSCFSASFYNLCSKSELILWVLCEAQSSTRAKVTGRREGGGGKDWEILILLPVNYCAQEVSPDALVTPLKLHCLLISLPFILCEFFIVTTRLLIVCFVQLNPSRRRWVPCWKEADPALSLHALSGDSTNCPSFYPECHLQAVLAQCI